MDRRQGGVRSRGNSIQIDFYHQGIRCRETLGIPPTKQNLQYAERMRSAILHEIALGTFDYSKHFPNGSKSHLFGSKPRLKLSDALDHFLDVQLRRTAPSTWRDYKSAIEHHLKPAFADKYLDEVTTSDIKDWIATLSDLSNKRINNVLVPLRGTYADAFAEAVIERNPLDRIRNLPVRQDEPDPFTPQEIGKILEHAESQSRNLFQFAFWSGLRTSELIGLEWRDINLDSNIVDVRRACVRKITKETKTKAGTRQIKLLPLAAEALKAQLAYTHDANHRVFHNPRTDEPWETDGQIRKTAWMPTLKRAGVRYRNPYQTRHTYASLLLSAGENPMWVAQQMDHKDWGMIRARYGRWIPELDPTSGDKIISFWSQHGHKESAND